MMNKQDSFQAEKLDWLAFRYIAEEMSGEEREAFERQLLADQSTREAVALSVEMAQAAAAVSSDATKSRGGGSLWGQRLTWMAIGAAACLALVVLPRHLAPPIDQLSRHPGAPQIASYWVELQEDQGEDWGDTQAAGPEEFSEEEALNEDEPTSEVPDWLLKAVSGHGGDEEQGNLREEN